MFDCSDPAPGTTVWSSSARVLVDQGVFVSSHALDRFREHHPRAGFRGSLASISCSDEVEPGLIAPFLRRRLEAVRDRYFIVADRLGTWVVTRNRRADGLPWFAVTYLRFDAHQQAVAERLLGGVSSRLSASDARGVCLIDESLLDWSAR